MLYHRTKHYVYKWYFNWAQVSSGISVYCYRLNMPHDDDPKCLRYRDSSRVHNVMSRMLDHKAYPWAWSNCSRHVLTEFLE